MKLKKILLLLLFPLIFLSGCSCSNELVSASKNISNYTMDIVYLDDKTLNVAQTLDYRNNTETRLDVLKFHLYPRAFRQGAKSSVVSNLNYAKCYYNGASYGNIEITGLAVNDNEHEIKYSGNDEDILAIDVNLAPDAHAKIYFEYHVTLPNISHRFGYGESTINVANFYPIACVYEGGEYMEESYHYNGDPFYSDISNYNVTLTAPNSLKLATTGVVESTNNSNDMTNTYSIKALAVRDYAFVLSDKFEIVTSKVDNTVVNYYYYANKYPAECLRASVDALTTFNRLFGKYPYSVLNVVETDFVHGGMEYPNLVYISDEVDVQSDYINVIVHEIAHQWWYGLVGNNQYDYGWLDEGLTEYSTILFYRENPSYNVNTNELIKNTTNSYVSFIEISTKVFGEVDTTMNRALDEFNNESEYVYIAYVKGQLMFDNLYEILGRDKFIKCLQLYFKQNKFRNATPQSLLSAFERASHTPLKNVFDCWIDGKVKIIPIS